MQFVSCPRFPFPIPFDSLKPPSAPTARIARFVVTQRGGERVFNGDDEAGTTDSPASRRSWIAAAGSAAFLDRLTAATGRDPRPKRRGPKPKGEPNGG